MNLPNFNFININMNGIIDFLQRFLNSFKSEELIKAKQKQSNKYKLAIELEYGEPT